MKLGQVSPLVEHLPGQHNQKTHGRKMAIFDKLPSREIGDDYKGNYTGYLYRGSSLRTAKISAHGEPLRPSVGTNTSLYAVYVATNPKTAQLYARSKKSTSHSPEHYIGVRVRNMRVGSLNDQNIRTVLDKVDRRIMNASKKLNWDNTKTEQLLKSRGKQYAISLKRAGYDALSYGYGNALAVINPKVLGKTHHLRVRSFMLSKKRK